MGMVFLLMFPLFVELSQMSVETEPTRPGPWLESLTKLQPAPWRWGRSIRAALSVGLPFLIGLLSNDLMTGMWVAMGALMQTTGERNGTYDSVFRHMALAAPLGALGYLAGYLGLLPWPATVACMALLAFAAGILSSYGAALSVGCLQALLVASIAIGVPGIAPFWQPALLYLVGTLLYAALLGIEALFFHQRPRRNMLSGLFNALATLAMNRAEQRPIDEPRRQVTARLATAHTALLHQRRRMAGRSLEQERSAAILQRSDAIFAVLLACDDADALRAAAQRLHQISGALTATSRFAATALGTPDSDLDRHLRALTALLNSQATFDPPLETATAPALPPSAHQVKIRLSDRLIPSRDTWLSAAALALAIAIAYAMRWLDSDAHWFWIPLTVGLIMKPDFGSIVARSLLRSLGTLAGVVIGAAILLLIPKSIVFVLVMAILAALLPWAMQRSYALQAVVLTPLILMLVDIILPGGNDLAFALQRLLDTVIGAAIVIVFGYLVWPKGHQPEIAAQFTAIRRTLADYLQACLPETAAPGLAPDTRPAQIRQYRRQAYRQLTGLRAQLQRFMCDPPPAGSKTAAWFPLLDSAERLCDDITIYSVQTTQPPAEDMRHALALQVEQIGNASLRPHPPQRWPGPRPSCPEARLIERIDSELQHMRTLCSSR
ncbi:FUSC family protein [Kerstersia sp.]|uniref:FUSC family protein n=1 Tax=Kerstersia sp. TaxID=1930783 RepID=UPI003F9004CC